MEEFLTAKTAARPGRFSQSSPVRLFFRSLIEGDTTSGWQAAAERFFVAPIQWPPLAFRFPAFHRHCGVAHQRSRLRIHPTTAIFHALFPPTKNRRNLNGTGRGRGCVKTNGAVQER